ncbi:MAG: hypothetical protein ACREMU_10645, partial [Gemmatimonadaceae bacterium]
MPERPPTERQPDILASFATAAYRADLAGRIHPFGEHDSEWIVIASLLEQAAQLPQSEASAVLHEAERIAADIASPGGVDALVRREWQSTEVDPADPIVAIAEEAHDRNAFRTAAHILDSLLAANRSLTELQRGRVLSRRARFAFRLGDLDGAADRYAQIVRLGRTVHSADLAARGWVGRAAIAQFHGNYPEVWRCGLRAARIADRHELRTLSYHAHTWLMIAAGASGRVDDCLAHGWIAYQRSAAESREAIEVLVNVAQALLETGRAREARAGFAAAIATDGLPAHCALPALGGLAIASAVLGDEPRVQWVAREVSRFEKAGASRCDVASALLECATAFTTLGHSA